ncbi:MAG: PdxA family dehydrogenase, partial [Litorivicinaceae bacterium]
MTDRPRIALPMGDPAGVGPEIVLKALLDPTVQAQPVEWCVIGDPAVITATGRLLDRQICCDGDALQGLGFNCHVQCPEYQVPVPIVFGQTTSEAGRLCYHSAELAVQGVLAGDFDAVAAAPHTEASVNAAGIPFTGYPSLLARLCPDAGPIQLLMMGGHLAVIHVTLHQSLASAVAAITPARVIATIEVADRFFKQLTPSPRIAVCGLNPHAGEGGLFGTEDQEIIAPAVIKCQEQGVDVVGPISPDALFYRQDFDCIVAMYHDQGHIPVKTIAPRSSIALSIGADVLFGTVAHGSALDIAGQGVADASAYTRLAL